MCPRHVLPQCAPADVLPDVSADVPEQEQLRLEHFKLLGELTMDGEWIFHHTWLEVNASSKEARGRQ